MLWFFTEGKSFIYLHPLRRIGRVVVPIAIVNGNLENRPSIFTGEMAEWSNAAVLKTVEGHTSGGSNPSFSA